MVTEYLSLVRKRAEQKLLFLPHAIRQMMHPDRMITTLEVRKVIFEGEIIDYPDDARGHSCLSWGMVTKTGLYMWYVLQKTNIWQ